MCTSYFFSIVGLFMSIPMIQIINIPTPEYMIVANWATPLLIFVLLFYLNLSFLTFLKMLLFSVFCLAGNYYLSQIFPLFYISIAIFVLSWIGQFYGHKLEGKKPSFFKDLQFLLIGPAWVFEKITHKKNL